MILKRFVYKIIGKVREFLYGPTRAEMVCSRLKNEREMIFDFTDIERLCYKPVTVKLPGKSGSKCLDAWLDSCCLTNDGSGPERIEVTFRKSKEDILEASADLFKDDVEEIEE